MMIEIMITYSTYIYIKIYGITIVDHCRDTGVILYENICIICLSKILCQNMLNGNLR
jgi:hypothetical protein